MAAPHPYATTSSLPGSDAGIPTQRFVWDQVNARYRECKRTDPFIKGPIPLKWVMRANALPGKAGAVGLALWFLAGVKGTRSFKVTAEAVRVAACSRQAFSHGLNALEGADLIAVRRQPGARPEVMLR